jgi:hypothetical protein
VLVVPFMLGLLARESLRADFASGPKSARAGVEEEIKGRNIQL